MLHVHSIIANRESRTNRENIRKAIRYTSFKSGQALTDDEHLINVQRYFNDCTITRNSVAPRISDMVKECPPRMVEVGVQEFVKRNGSKGKKRTTRATTKKEQQQWIEKNKDPQMELFPFM